MEEHAAKINDPSNPAPRIKRAIPSKPIDSTDVKLKPDLRDLQANILKGHGRTQAINLFFNIIDRKLFRAFAKNLPILNSLQQLRDSKEHKNDASYQSQDVVLLALSAKGLSDLGHSSKFQGHEAFNQGMSRRPLKDKVADFEFTDPHGWLMFATDDPKQLQNRLIPILSGSARAIEIVRIEHGKAYKNANGDGIEHFGYVDGRSQPLFLLEDLAIEQRIEGTHLWNPKIPPAQILVDDPLSPRGGWGSFFVFRKLEQNVAGFKAKEAELAAQLNLIGEHAERAGALVVGRSEDGTPIVESDSERSATRVPNNFNYASDKMGEKCPFHAHVRATNPRIVNKKGFLMARRGITYGEREIVDGEFKDSPSNGVGLLFQAYMASIEKQFEQTQINMANAGDDPVIGLGIQRSQQWPCALPCGGTTALKFADFVTTRGGGYFFAPSLSGIKNL
jgi:Dyp-type peroxidase family